MPSRRQIDDRQPPMSQRQPDVALKPVTEVIGTTMSQGASHGSAGSVEVRSCPSYESGNPAHDLTLPPGVDVLVAPRTEESELHAPACEGAYLEKAEAIHESLGLSR